MAAQKSWTTLLTSPFIDHLKECSLFFTTPLLFVSRHYVHWELRIFLARKYISAVSTFTSVETLNPQWWFYNDWREQNLHSPKIPKIPDEQSAGFMHRPKIPKNPKIFEELSGKTLTKFQKILGFLVILGLCMNPALCSSGILGILGLCRFGELSPSLESQNLHRPKIPKIPDEQSAGFMHRPKIPKNPKIFRNYQARPWQSSKESWDSWESWACAWILRFVHQDSWESWACAGLVSFLHLWSHKTCTGPRFPRIPMNKVRDSCTGPRFPRIPRFLGTIRQDPGKVPKNLGILGNLGPVHESCTLFIRILGNLGPVQVWWALPAQAQDSQDSWWTKCRIPAQAQDSQESQDFWGTIRQDPDKVPKNLGILGNLGPVHESCTLFIRNLGNLGPVQVWWAFSIFGVTKPAQAQDSQDSWWTKCRIHAQAQDSQESQDFWESIRQEPVHESCTLFIGILGNLGPVQVLWRSYVKLCCLFEKMHFPCVFWWWTSELVQRVFIF